MFVLAIDTSSQAVTAGVATDAGAVLAERSVLAPRGHGELLAPTIADCLDCAGLAPADVGAVVAGLGPGPYTGLRVGLVTAAAFAHARAVPTYGVCSLDAITAVHAAVVVASDARRREVYWARYHDGARVDGPHVDRPGDVPTEGIAAVAGRGAVIYADEFGRTSTGEEYPRVERLVALALPRVRSGAPSEPLTPLYLRRPDAVVPGAPKRASQ